MSNEQEKIAFTPELRDSLRETYDNAVQNSHEMFRWDGREYVTSYAKYLLQYLDMQFKNKIDDIEDNQFA